MFKNRFMQICKEMYKTIFCNNLSYLFREY